LFDGIETEYRLSIGRYSILFDTTEYRLLLDNGIVLTLVHNNLSPTQKKKTAARSTIVTQVHTQLMRKYNYNPV